MEEQKVITVKEVRDIQTVTTEINTLTAQYRSLTLAYAVEVGRRLEEAKSLLPHGEWGTWLAEKVSFSQRTANNLMQIFEEYGDSQITLFGAVPNSQTFANLPISKAIKLLALPSEEREAFAEENDVAAMSVRELEAAIKAKKEAEARAEELTEENERLQEQLDHSGAEALADAEEERDKALADLAALKKAADAAAEELKAAKEEAEKAKADAKKAKDKLKEAKAHPEIPQEKLDELRAEAAEKANQAIEERIAEAQRKIAEAEKRRLEAESKYETVRKQAQISDPDVLSFKMLFEQVQDDADKLLASLARIRDKSPETADKLGKAVTQMVASSFGGLK